MKMERNARVHEISFYCGAIKACEFLDMNGNEMKTESIHYLVINKRINLYGLKGE
jgi:hypothetical protein